MTTSTTVTPADILTGARKLLEERGRHFGDWEYGGKLCVLAAMAMAAGRLADYWEELSYFVDSEDRDEVDEALLAAGRALAGVVAPLQADRELGIEQLIGLLSDWHDGPEDEDGTYRDAPANSYVFAELAKAALLLDEAGDAA